MAAFLELEYYDENGEPVGNAAPVYLPDYLDRRHIRAKALWFLTRGLGEPTAKLVVLKSQGQRMLALIENPLQALSVKQLKENENGLESSILRYLEEQGLGTSPLNQ